MDIALAQSELVDRLTGLGWSLGKVDFKQGAYVARATGPNGEKIKRTGTTPEFALASLIHYATRVNSVRKFTIGQKFAAWQNDWIDMSDEISQDYSSMPQFDEKAVPAWKSLAAESKIQADAIRRQVDVNLTNEPEPYKTAKDMCDDVHKNHHLTVSRAHSKHPIWSEQDVINYRIVHDVLGVCQSGGNWSWVGANLATKAHMPLLTPLAQEALFVEEIAHSAYRKHYKGHGPVKIGLLNHYVHPMQEEEGDHVHVPHGGIPKFESPEKEIGYGSSVVAAQIIHSDPNEDWSPKQISEQVNPSNPDHKNLDYINIAETIDNAEKINTHWWEKDESTQNQAILNAFRVALLSPMKNLRWNAAQYQAIMHMRPDATAMDMWEMLEKARNDYNEEMGFKGHDPWAYRDYVHSLAHDLMSDESYANYSDAYNRAKEIIHSKIKEFEQALSQDEEVSYNEALKLYLKARKMTGEWLEELQHSKQQKLDLTTAKQEVQDQMSMDDGWDVGTPEDKDTKYGYFMSSSLDAISRIGKIVDDIREVAIKDIEETGGKGHIFRSYMMDLNIPSVKSKVVSFAWLLLRPTSSDLGIIDAHMCRVLGIPAAPSSRDYYKAERMQKAFKDSTGYQHVPLGVYHWGLWDMARSPGTHSDHSALSVLNPSPWDSPDQKWHSDPNRSDSYIGPQAFEVGRPHAELAAQEFEQEFAGSPKNRVPRKSHVKVSEKTLREKRKDLKSKLEDFDIGSDEDAGRFGFYAVFQVEVTKKQFEDFLDDQDKRHRSSSTWDHFKKKALKTFKRLHGGPSPRMWIW